MKRAAVPTEEELAAKARELGLVDESGAVDRRNRSRVAQAVLQDRQAAKPAPVAQGRLLSRTVTVVPDGYVTVEVRHVKAGL